MRRVVFVKPHYFVVFDELRTNGEPASFDWLLHLPDRTKIKTEPMTAIYKSRKAALATRVFAPDDVILNIQDGRIPYPVFSARTPQETPAQPAILDLQTPQRTNGTQFLVALVPARTDGEAHALASRMTEIKSGNLIGLRAERGDETDFVMFRVGENNAASSYENWNTDADAWTVTENKGKLKIFAVQNARSFAQGGRVFFASDNPASVAASYNAYNLDASFHLATAAKIRLFVGAKPMRVMIDGRETNANFNSSEGTITIGVPAGQHGLKIMLR
jgi:hypothetical protein